MKHIRYIAAVSLLALSACSNGTVRETLGLSRSSPDEYRVVSRPPLSVPPQFTLRPPSVGDSSPNKQDASDEAKSIVLGTKDDTASQGATADTAVVPVTSASLDGSRKKDKVSGADTQFLADAGANQADPQVRKELAEEKFAVQDQQDDTSWWNFWSSSPPKKDPIVDARKESNRIQTDEAQGKPVTDGDTPEVKQKDSGILGRILGD